MEAREGLGPGPATKITYIDGRPTTITLRRCQLALLRGEELKEYVFERDVVTLGAMEDNDLVVDDETVSRNHCRIVREGDQYVLVDNGSTNGTFVNRVRIREAYLHANCTITLGKTDIKFQPIDEKLSIVPSDRERYGDIIGRDRSMREIYAILEKIAPTDTTVVIEGETGTGKEVVAR
ncbi:MAG: FHA domain-containing protein, partial [Myxococcales bacterium]|nr:FHA domain-containing protein [Myxococcales bacterium]